MIIVCEWFNRKTGKTHTFTLVVIPENRVSEVNTVQQKIRTIKLAAKSDITPSLNPAKAMQ